MSWTQIASRSVQLFLQGSLVWQIDRPTGHITQLVTTGRIYKCSTMMRPNNSTGDNVYGAVIMARPLQSSPGSFDECRLSARWLLILKPSQPTWPESPVPGCYHPHPQSPFIIISQPERAWYSFYRPIEGGRLNQPRHCSKGVQAMSKAVYHGGCRDKHKCPRLAGEIRTHVLTQRSQACYQ